MYDVDVSEGLISKVTEGVMDEVKAWQSRPLDEVYPIIFLDCLLAIPIFPQPGDITLPFVRKILPPPMRYSTKSWKV